MSKPQLAILSDIFGTSEENWMKEYVRILSPFFDIVQIDSRALAGIDSLPQDEVHAVFVNGGIERAVQELTSKNNQPKAIIGFSVGGTIAWKYAFENSAVLLYLTSATRLRNETVKPVSPIKLYFGELEQNGPSTSWFEEHELNPEIIKKEGHECYKAQIAVELVCQQVLEDFGFSE